MAAITDGLTLLNKYYHGCRRRVETGKRNSRRRLATNGEVRFSVHVMSAQPTAFLAGWVPFRLLFWVCRQESAAASTTDKTRWSACSLMGKGGATHRQGRAFGIRHGHARERKARTQSHQPGGLCANKCTRRKKLVQIRPCGLDFPLFLSSFSYVPQVGSLMHFVGYVSS